MTSDTTQAPAPGQAPAAAAPAPAPPRVWPAVVLVGLYWVAFFVLGRLQDAAQVGMFALFLGSLASCVLLLLLFSVWWFLSGRVSRRDRLLVFGAAVACGVVAAVLSPAKDDALVPWLLLSLPVVFTAWAAWLLVARRVSARTRRLGLLAVLVLTWGAFTLVRTDGLWGNGAMAYHWRWTATPEELYLADRAGRPGAGPGAAEPLTLQPGDWPGFRGPDRDGTVHGVKLAADWIAASTHKPVWRQRIGPAWSSVAVVDGRLFTQEQRGPAEAVVCLDAATGREVWSHEDPARWSDGQAGPGPRATPTFAGGRVYALGATGILNCLDAATGARKWSKDIAADSGAEPPLWGFSSSPLVAEGLVVVFAGGEGDKGLLAYRADSGKLAWTAPAGHHSYSSPQLAVFGDEKQILFLGERGLTAYAPASGSVLWEYAGEQGVGLPRCTQPQLVGGTRVLIGSETDRGSLLLDVARQGSSWAATSRWSSRRLKPSFNDFVVSGGAVYGFDASVFCCLDLKTGKRRWKDGRYGNGQVLLLADQPLLLVAAEKGEVVLLAANPDRHEELGRFQAIKGKTWNHPVIAGGRLYVRNAEEIACFDLGGAGVAGRPEAAAKDR
jgi:outer membrane protein assembly factor BamB